jgi:hypothetical protein
MKTIILSALLLTPAAASAPSDDAAPGFCGRMAAQFAMKPVKPATGRSAYEARALKGLGTALFGGSAMVTMMLKPPASGDIGDPARYGTACRVAANRLACAVSGPAVFEMAVKDQTASTEARAGEAAEVSMVKNRIRCEDR